MNIDPENIIVFEDSVSGAEAASAAGATVIGVNKDLNAGPLKHAGAVTVYKDFRKAGIETGKKGIRMFSGGEKSVRSFMISNA